MSYRDIAKRLEALEQAQIATVDDGYAPEAWTRLAPWALLVHDVGGWDVAVAAQKAGTLPTENNPYAKSSGGPLWDLCLFWQRGTRRYLNRTQEQVALRVIVYCVSDLLGQGMSRAEINEWQTGRLIWDEMWQAYQKQQEAQ